MSEGEDGGEDARVVREMMGESVRDGVRKRDRGEFNIYILIMK